MKKYLISGSLMMAALIMVVACGKKDDGGGAPAATPAPAVAAPVGTGTTPGTCNTGYLYDGRYGCLAIASCQSGTAYYVDRCILVQSSNVGQGNCVVNSPDYQSCIANGGNNFAGNGFVYQGGNFIPYNGSYYQQPYYYGYGNPYYGYGSSYRGSASGSFWLRYGYGYHY